MSANSGLVINVIDNHTGDRHDKFLPQCRMKHPHHLDCHDVQSMVTVVSNAARSGKITVLRIFGHGHEGSQAVGGGRHPKPDQRFWVDERGRLHHSGMLQPLRNHFSPNATVELHGCEVAEQNRGLLLLRHLSYLWHVEVVAAFSKQHAHEKGVYDGIYVGMNGNRVYAYQLDAYALTTR